MKQVKLIRLKDSILEETINTWIQELHANDPKAKVLEITHIPNATRNESDIFIVYEVSRIGDEADAPSKNSKRKT